MSDYPLDEYLKDAMRTKSPVYCPELLRDGTMQNCLLWAIKVGEQAKLLKKACFSGKAPQEWLGDVAVDPDRVSKIPPDMLHAILGVLNEQGEIAQALYGVLYEGKELDPVNMDEEFGDLDWFDVLYAHSRNTSPCDIRRRNIAKLKARFPDKFDVAKMDDANRDHGAERKALGDVPGFPGAGFPKDMR